MASFHWPLAAFTAVPVVLGGIIGGSCKDDIEGWYSRLRKPSWEPPASAFGTIWTFLYACMGVSAYLVWKHTGYNLTSQPMLWFGAMLALNLLWPVIFFKQHNIQLASLENVALLAVTVHVAKMAYRIHPVAGKLMIPVAIWTAFANILNFVIMTNNSGNQAGAAHSPSGTTTHASRGTSSGSGHPGGPAPGHGSAASGPNSGTGGGYNYQPPTTSACHTPAKPASIAPRVAERNRGLGLIGRRPAPVRQIRAPAMARACPAAAARSFAFV